jgi:adenylate cyclase class IV
MLEKELKILDIDVEKVKITLLDLGARETFDGFIHDIYYDFPGDKMDENKRVFRVRKK